MLSTAWTGGGTDYGGCVGRHAGFDPQHFADCDMCDTWFVAGGFIPRALTIETDQNGLPGPMNPPPPKRWGIFGKPNVPTKFGDIADGLSYTIALGELGRSVQYNVDTPSGNGVSHDGWAIGDVATLFSAGIMEQGDTAVASGGIMMNNDNLVVPASEHVTGCNFGMADGSVHFFATQSDPNVFALLGSMADGVPVSWTRD